MRDLFPTQHSSAVSPSSESATVPGSLAVLALLIGALIAVSYPFVAVALLAGAVTGSVVRRGVARIRRRRTPAALTAGGRDVRAAGRDFQRGSR
jgi:hypothetical protein